MKKAVIAVVMCTILLVMNIVPASAQYEDDWWIEIENPSSDGINFQVVYHTTDASVIISGAYAIYMCYDPAMTLVSGTHTPPSGAMDFEGVVDDGAGALHVSMMNFEDTGLETDGQVLVTLQFDTAGTMGWCQDAIDEPAFELNVDLVGTFKGQQLMDDGHLLPSPASATVPVPGMTTIVLMSIGMLGLGGYVVLRRSRAAGVC